VVVMGIDLLFGVEWGIGRQVRVVWGHGSNLGVGGSIARGVNAGVRMESSERTRGQRPFCRAFFSTAARLDEPIGRR